VIENLKSEELDVLGICISYSDLAVTLLDDGHTGSGSHFLQDDERLASRYFRYMNSPVH